MYMCEKCEEHFDEPDKVKYLLGWEDGFPVYDFDYSCPFCGEIGYIHETEDNDDI